ncbi:MAG: CBM35 domain-containing protein, partial [Clostridia bacterium]
KGSSEGKQYVCSNAVLKGLARRMKCKALPGGQYVSGLDNAKGALLFDNINIEKAGEYTLTVDIKKKGQYEKFLIAKVNGSDIYQIEFPSQKFYNLTARFQVPVTLKAGVNTVELFNPIANNRDSAALLYQKMAYQLKSATARVATENHASNKPILFSICEWGMRKPWLWGASAGNMWRTTPDIRPDWDWINIIYNRTVKLHKYASPSHFNDPDMLEVGNGKLTYDENLSHFALWCMMCSPLVLGNDVRKISKPVLDIVTNKDLIAINQDKLAKQAKRMQCGLVDILAKPLFDGSVAICFFNKGCLTTTKSFDIEKLCKDNYVAMAKTNNSLATIVGDCALSGKTLTATIPSH